MGKMDKKLKTCLQHLKRRGFNVMYAKSREDARKIVVEMVPPDWIVGCGDSATVRSMGILQDLADMGHRILNPFVKPKILRKKTEPMPLRVLNQSSHGCDVFLASANAVTMDGKIVNIDGGGNRVSGIIFGSPIRILVVGRNKIVNDVDEALYRIKNVITPAHSKTVGSDWGVPCAATGKCIEPETFCKPGKTRACNIVTILESHPNMPGSKLVVVLVDDDLGLGWDPAWTQERKDKIYAEYKRFTPPHRPVSDSEGS